MTADVLRNRTDAADAKSRIDAWMRKNRVAVARCQQVLSDLKSVGSTDFAMMSVAMREIRALQQIEVS